jgi:hypothetical protein
VLLHRDAAPFDQAPPGAQVTVHRLSSTAGAGVVVVRPDGYVGFRAPVVDQARLRHWLGRIGAGRGGATGSIGGPITGNDPIARRRGQVNVSL